MKLPVFKAVGMTFAFVLAHWLDLLKIMWLPLVLVIGVSAFIAPSYMQSMMAVGGGGATDPEAAMAAMSAALPMALLLFVVSIAAYLIIFAGILKLVIRGEKPSLPFYLGFGSDEWRLLGTWVLLMLIFIGVEIVAGIVGGLATGLAISVPGGGAYIAIAIGFVIFVALCWVGLRFSLATPAAIGAQTIGIGPSWNTSKGNVWALFFYWLIWGLIFFIVEVVLITILMPGYFQAMGDIFNSAGDPERLQSASEAMTASAMAMYDFSSPLNIVKLAASALIGTFLFATFAVAGGVAWRLMTDSQPEKHFD